MGSLCKFIDCIEATEEDFNDTKQYGDLFIDEATFLELNCVKLLRNIKINPVGMSRVSEKLSLELPACLPECEGLYFRDSTVSAEALCSLIERPLLQTLSLSNTTVIGEMRKFEKNHLNVLSVDEEINIAPAIGKVKYFSCHVTDT